MKTLTEAVYRISPPSGFFDDSVIRNLFPDRSRGAQHLLLDRAIRAGEVLRLKNGLFVLAPEYQRSDVHPFSVAAMLYSPSHVSLETALSHHGLIPEAVYQVSSTTVRRRRTFKTPLGTFVFHCVPLQYPRAGVEAVKLDGGCWVHIAMPLRAIADIVYLNRQIAWHQNGIGYLLESLRIEETDLRGLHFDRCNEIIDSFRSRRVKEFLKQLRKEFEP